MVEPPVPGQLMVPYQAAMAWAQDGGSVPLSELAVQWPATPDPPDDLRHALAETVRLLNEGEHFAAYKHAREAVMRPGWENRGAAAEVDFERFLRSQPAATPTPDYVTIRRDDLAIVLTQHDYIEGTQAAERYHAALARLRAALPQDGAP